MPHAVPTATPPRSGRFQNLLNQLAATEQALLESPGYCALARSGANARLVPQARLEIQEVLELADHIHAKLQMLRGVVEGQAAKLAVRGSRNTKAEPAPAHARDEARARFEALLAQGELLESAAFQQRAGITRQALSKAIQARRMFYLDVGGVRAYPAFFLDSTLQRVQLEAVSKLLGDLSGGSKWLFFTSPKGSLANAETGQARTPIQALRDGDLERVKKAALGHASR
jgi:hypothetical protein